MASALALPHCSEECLIICVVGMRPTACIRIRHLIQAHVQVCVVCELLFNRLLTRSATYAVRAVCCRCLWMNSRASGAATAPTCAPQLLLSRRTGVSF